MKAYLRCTPFDDPLAELEITDRCSITELLERVSAPEWFHKYGVVNLNDHEIPSENWRHVRLKPGVEGNVELVYAPKNTKTALLLASVALLVATAFIAAGGIATIATSLGIGGAAAFGAGTLGASLSGAGTAESDSGIAELLAAHPL